MGALVKSVAEILAQVPAQPARAVGAQRAKVREWAEAYGFVDADGPLSADVVAMYRALHPGGDV